MAGRFVRSSKFRHVFGTPAKTENQFTSIRLVNDGSTDGFICAVNPKFVAVATKPQGGGAFLVLSHEEEKRVEVDHPQVRGHKGKVLDLAWNPFNDNVIASGDDHATVYIWDIPEGGLTTDLITPTLTLSHHQKKIVKILWHPTAENILLTSAYDSTIKLWNLATTEIMLDIVSPDVPLGFAWDHNGGRFAATCKDKYCRIYDSHTGDELKKWQAHEGSKPQMIAFTKEGILTTGFSRMSQREYALWDEKTLAEKFKQTIDDSNGVNIITNDPDTGMFYLAAKGDSLIRYFEVTSETPYIHYLSAFNALPQTCAASMPKRGLDVNANEVMRFYRIEKSAKGNTSTYNVIPTAMTVPRKSDQFQDDIFPPTPGDEPAVSASEWEEGKTKDPILMSLKAGYKPKQKTVSVGKMVNKMPERSTGKKESGSAVSGVSSGELKSLKDDINTLKSTVQSQEAKIASLEKQLSKIDDNTSRISALEATVDDLGSKVDSFGSGDAE